MSKIAELALLGQSVWIDYIRRYFITSGELQAMIDEGLRGMTSNPTIFDKAISGSSDYDQDIVRLADEGKSDKEILDALLIEDILMAAELFLPVHERSGGTDGFVSLEANPRLAHDTAGTIAEVKRLFRILDSPNIMIKVPATPEGILAIEELIGAGINVNITLIFGVEVYEEVAEAYLRGLEKLAESGPSEKGWRTIDTIASVASIFVSRVDTAVDEALEKIGHLDLQGKIAVANAKVAYSRFKQIFRGERWERLKAKGAHVQKVLWGSTGVKNPHYPDTLYIDELIGADTINTIPPQTYNAFKDHGRVALTVESGIKGAESQLSRLKGLGIDLTQITTKLLNNGVDAFSKSFDSLESSIQKKREHLQAGKIGFRADLGRYAATIDASLMRLCDAQVSQRIWKGDHTVWKRDPREIKNRLGWLHSPERMMEIVPQLSTFAEEVSSEGFVHALLLGMGGSSLAPEMFRSIFGVKKGFLDLHVLDSTDPGTILALENSVDMSRILFIVSTKSGETVETISFLKYFYTRILLKSGKQEAGKRFIAITDPGSGLESMAKELKFRRVFLNDPKIGGRYSALSYFGLVPAALIGMDLTLLLNRALEMSVNSESCNSPTAGDNTAARLGVIMGELAIAGRDKLTLVLSPPIAHLGLWLEQLLAESTGKDGKGILPVNGEDLVPPDLYAPDRLFVHIRLAHDHTDDEKIQLLKRAGHPIIRIRLRDLHDIGSEIFRWEMATAIAGMIIGINPFDQPNVESAKIRAREYAEVYKKEGILPGLPPAYHTERMEVSARNHAGLRQALGAFFEHAAAGDSSGAGRSYISIQAYLRPAAETGVSLQMLRTIMQKKYRMATTVGYGPRFLHSTGQLHKGDAGHGLFIQLTADDALDVPIPEQAGKEVSSITFGILKEAQALGDARALLDSGRTVIRLHLGKDIQGALKELMNVMKG